MFCFPWKYPFKIEDIAIIGTMGLIVINGYNVRSSVNSVDAMNGAANNIPAVKIMLVIPVTMRDTIRILFTFLWSFFAVASATRFDIAIGRPSWVRLITKIIVGRASITNRI